MVQIKKVAAKKALPAEPVAIAEPVALQGETDADASPAGDDGKAKKKAKKERAKDKKKKKKEAVMIRFEAGQLALIDAAADGLGLSRAAWVRMVVARALTP